MKGAVVYFSKYGNNEKTAQAVAQGLQEAGHEVALINAKQSKELGEDFDFVVFGSPTRAGKNSGPVKKFIKNNLDESWKGKPFAAFGTCLKATVDKNQSSAAKDIHAELTKRGLTPLAEPFDNAVSGMKGPLLEGGEEAARSFGKEVGGKL